MPPPPQLSLHQSSNLHFHPISFADYCRLVSDRLGIDFQPERPYKLCDLRPFYAIVHSDLLREGNYDFWGFADLDLVWGDLKAFYTDDLLHRYDIFSTHDDRFSGHLCLLRNKPSLNTAALRLPHWKERLCSQQNYALDEMAFTLLFYPQARLLWKVHRHLYLRYASHFRNEFRSYGKFCQWINALCGLRRRGIYLKEMYTSPYVTPNFVPAGGASYRYADGHITDLATGEALPYLHFVFLKTIWTPQQATPPAHTTDLLISPDGILPWQSSKEVKFPTSPTNIPTRR